jgi:diguanylate cyclase (GGDEF)-like protein
MKTMPIVTRWHKPPGLSGLAIAVLLAALAFGNIALMKQSGGIPVIRPGQGLLLGILLTSPPSERIRHCLVGLFGLTAGIAATGASLASCLIFSSITVLDVLIAYGLVRRFMVHELDLLDPLSLVRFVGLAAVVMPLINTAVFAVMPQLRTPDYSPGIIMATFLSNSLGVIVLLPFVWLFRSGDFTRSIDRRSAESLAISLLITVATALCVFSQSRYPLLFVAIPPLVISVFLAGTMGGALSLVAAVAIAFLFTLGGAGPTVLMAQAGNVERIIIIQIFSCMAAAVVLLLSAVLDQRNRAQALLEETQHMLLQLATVDKLTGLANRHRFDEVLANECRRAARTAEPLSLLLLDVDHFKLFNDSYGHQAGDECLRALAAAIRFCCQRPADLCARYGGEELAVVLPNTGEAGALEVAAQLLCAIRELAIPHAGNQKCGGIVTASIGVTTASAEELAYDPERLIQLADLHLYEAKRLGRDRAIARDTMASSPVPPVLTGEEQRIAAVAAYRSQLSAERSSELDWIARIAATMLGSPIGLVSLVDRDDQVFVGRYGLDTAGTSRDVSFCAHAIAGELPMVIPDSTQDPRFQANPLVTGDLNIRFYAGAPLVDVAGSDPVGALCVIDNVPHPKLSAEQSKQLSNLAALASKIIENTINGHSQLAA